MIYMFLADGFEEVEALCPADIIKRAGLDITTVGIGKKTVTGAHGFKIEADICDDELFLNDPEMIFLPGGMPGTLHLAASETVKDAILFAECCDSYIAAICAAPSILGDMGLLSGKKATCYPGFEDKLTGARLTDETVVLDGKILTAKGMGVALEMGLKIVEIFCGKEKAEEIRYAVIAD